MTTDDDIQQTTDRWGRPVLDGEPRFGPLDGDEQTWPAVPMRVRDDDDVVMCATGFARAFSSEYFFTIWLLAVDGSGWTTKAAAELLDLPSVPPDREAVLRLVARVAPQLHDLSVGCSVVVAIAEPDGGDRGARELAWTRALVPAATASGLPVRGVVAVGAHRARLLHSSRADSDVPILDDGEAAWPAWDDDEPEG